MSYWCLLDCLYYTAFYLRSSHLFFEVWCKFFSQKIREGRKNKQFLNSGIIRFHGGSVFVVFMTSPPPQIFILDENKFRIIFLTETTNPRIHKFTSPQINKKPIYNPQKLAPKEFKWFHSIEIFLVKEMIFFIKKKFRIWFIYSSMNDQLMSL